MTTNRLAKSENPVIDRSKWSLAEHCEYANAQLILNETNEYRRKIGAPPVHWVIRDGRVVCEQKRNQHSNGYSDLSVENAQPYAAPISD